MELNDFEWRYNCGRYDRCLHKFDVKTGYLRHPEKYDLMFDRRENEGIYVVDMGIAIDNENGYRRNMEVLQTGNPRPYPNYPDMGLPLAAFIQYVREKSSDPISSEIKSEDSQK